MEDKNNIENELGNTAPFLSKMDKANKFEVPANYFEEFPMKMADKIHVRHAAKENWAAKYFRPLLIPAIAAIVLAIGIGIYFNYNDNKQVNIASSVHTKINMAKDSIAITDYVDEDVLVDAYTKDLEASKHSFKSKEQDTLVNILIDQTDVSDLNEQL